MFKKLKNKLELWDQYNNPFYYYWKVRKLFKRLKCHFMYGKDIWFFGLPIRKEYYNPIISIRTEGLGWKTKYGEFRHEWDPYIQICFFRKWHLIWIFNWVTKDDKDSSIRNMATWEAILEYLYNKESLKECIDSNQWGPHIGDENGSIITPYDNLTDYGKAIYDKKQIKLKNEGHFNWLT